MRLAPGIVCAAVGALVLAVAGGVPAQAAASEIEISVDGGATWYTDGAPAIFTNLGTLAPGMSQTASVQVRNTSGVNAVVRVAEVVAQSASQAFVTDLDFHARTDGVDGSVVRDVALGICVPLLDGQVVAPGEITEIDLTISLDEASANESQGGVAPIEFVVSLVELTGGALPAVGCSDGASSGGDRPAVIANTGADWMSLAGTGAALAMALIGGGLMAVAAGRRPRRES